MTREEIIANSGILLVGGSETTASLLSAVTFYLLTHPSHLKRVQDEVRSAFQTEKDINLQSVGTAARLPYMEAVLKESLRLYPPLGALMPRMTGPEGDMIDGMFIPPNVSCLTQGQIVFRLISQQTSVGVHQWAAYHLSTNFADPDSFVPERWFAEPPERYRADDRAVFQPFGFGPRNCIGQK